ncbi:MAG: phytanoyl-CoA dioxygenase family protein [Solirubrobacterales bacterium]|nr:phytanoyl-CoA dioxygenase family protein [Solirubrobacterales bacterium]
MADHQARQGRIRAHLRSPGTAASAAALGVARRHRRAHARRGRGRPFSSRDRGRPARLESSRCALGLILGDGARRPLPRPERSTDGPAWSARHPEAEAWDIYREGHPVVPVCGHAGDLVLFDGRLPHGSLVNRGRRPRVVQYVLLSPVGYWGERLRTTPSSTAAAEPTPTTVTPLCLQPYSDPAVDVCDVVHGGEPRRELGSDLLSRHRGRTVRPALAWLGYRSAQGK